MSPVSALLPGTAPGTAPGSAVRAVTRTTVLALVAAYGSASAVAAASVQSDGGTVFENTHLPFEALKAPPDSAFDIAMVSTGVFLLAWLSVAAFLVLAKLGAIQRAVEAQVAAVRAAGEAAGAADAPAVDLEPLVERLDALRAAVEAVEAGVERAGDAAARSAVEPPSIAGLDGLREAIERLAEQQDRQARALDRVAEAAAAVPPPTAGAGASAPAAPPRAPLAERVRTHLAALGYSEVTVLTPAEELDDEHLTSGHLVVEARRSGAVHKGRVTLEGGLIADVQLRPAHQIFP